MIDLRNTILGFRDGNKDLPSEGCPDVRTLINSDKSWGCTVNATYANMSSPVWIGYANHFKNIISVGLKVKNNNITSIVYNGTTITDDDIIDGVEVRYTVELFACYKNSDCGDVRPGYIDESWKKVIKMTNEKIKIDHIYQIGDESASATLLGNTFQNQESLPNKGKVRSYLMWVYYEEDINLFSGNSDNIHYKFFNINRPLRKAGNAVLVVVLFCTLVVFGLYVRTLLRNSPNFSKTLPEQKWIIYYFVALILYQNPVYCVICWMKDPDVKSVYTAYIFDAFAQASFFVIWLLFSDGLSRKTSYYAFYIPKYLMGLLIFATSVVVLTLQFPTINAYDERSPVEAVYNWSYNTKITFCAFSLAFLCLLLIWTLWWCISLWYTASSLQKHPYMSTRYLQLSFRFFFLQATLVTLYYVFQYFVVLYFILEYSPPYYSQSLENITDNINTLFRQQTLNIGKICFLTTYGIILAFFFLPAGSLQSNDAVVVPLSSTYVVTESEAEDITRSRRRALRKMKNINQYLYNARAEVYCVDLAMEMMELSFQSYNDSETLDTGFGYGKMDLEDLGYTLVESIFNSEHETVCYIMRNDATSRVAVVFRCCDIHKFTCGIIMYDRGTSTKQHWNDNLNYSQKRLNMFEQRLIALDQLDGLHLRHMENSGKCRMFYVFYMVC